MATARSHSCEEVFNLKYKPKTTEERDLFIEKQKFIYSVFDECLLTDMGKALVRWYESTFDAQKIYEELEKDATTSTQATIDTTELLTYLTSTKLGKTPWNGTYHAFILHWCEQLRKYEGLIDKTDHFTANVKMIMLQNAVSHIPRLHSVKTQAAHDIAHGKPPLSYINYKTLLLSAATVEDEKLSFASTRPQCTVQLTEQSEFSSANDNVHNIDTDIGTLAVHYTGQSNQSTSKGRYRPSMTKDQWNSLSSEEKVTWDSFSPQTKATILGFKKPVVTPSTTPTKVNLHDISVADYICMLHSQSVIGDTGDNNSTSSDTSNNIYFDSNTDDNDTPTPTPSSDHSNLLAYATKQKLPPGDLRRVLSSKPSQKSPPKATKLPASTHHTSSTTQTSAHTVTIDGKIYRQVNVHERVTYNISAAKSSMQCSLVDRGANGGLAGSDVRIVHPHANPRLVDVSGIDSHKVTDLPIVTVGGVVPSQRGDVIAIMHQYAYLGEGKTIHSSGQLEMFKNDVNDKSLKVSGGLQRIKTQDGYVHPLDIKNGLPYIPMRPYTDKEWDTLPHVEWTSDMDWDPTVLDQSITDKETWYDTVSDLENLLIHSPFDEFGNFKEREAELHFFDVGEIPASDGSGEITESPNMDDIIDRACGVIFAHELQSKSTSPSSSMPSVYNSKNQKDSPVFSVFPTKIQPTPREYESLHPFFLHQSVDTIKRTFEATTQYARTNIGGLQLKKTFKTPFAACNVHRRNEAVATDTVFSDVPAIDDGSTAAQLFVGRESLVTDAYGIKTEKQFFNTLEDNIQKRGAIDKLISNRAQVEISNRVLSILRGYTIDSWQSEPHYQHQNFAERRYATIKPSVNILLNLTGAPA